MSAARRQILDAVRRALGRGAAPSEARARIEARLARPGSGPIPARARLAAAARVDLFVAMAEEAAATVARVAAPEAVPAAVAGYLAAENLPARLRLAPDAGLAALPWADRPSSCPGVGRADDAVSLTPAFAGVAETGTLVLVSGPDSPTTLNLLPDTHIVLLETGRVVGAYEEVWSRLRAQYGAGHMPRTVNLITGPSRSADIEQTLQMGAHGPRRLHIILVDDQAQG
jgi:L-lactate dehydrogenase complex protein LldG